MTTAGQPHGPDEVPPSAADRFFGIVLVFLLAGPPVGGIVTWVVMLGIELSRGRPVAGHGAIVMLVYMIVLSYPVGGLLALVAGLIHAIAAVRLHRYAAVVPVVTGCLAGLVGAMLLAWLKPGFSSASAQFKAGITVLLPASLIACGVCWHLTRRLARTA